MKPSIAAIIAISLSIVSPVMAFDPAGPPPNKTFEWTIQYLTEVTYPVVSMDKDTVVRDCIDYMRLSRPLEYRMEIDVSSIEEAKLSAPIQIEINARNIKVIDFLAKIADIAQANIVIEPGKVRLIPRNTAPKPGAVESAKKPTETASPKVPDKTKP
ncbi:MAG: hypothetical protein CFE26_15995 [Verrucomicrobiales bacterium VVV1]|nr:MAG: hypothetical protein CFE26_15995 [Verrucomicrobiales bacterium VVV1]